MHLHVGSEPVGAPSREEASLRAALEPPLLVGQAVLPHAMGLERLVVAHFAGVHVAPAIVKAVLSDLV